MNKSWPRVRLGDVLRRSEEMAVIVPDVEYREITVRLWGKGVTERGRISGAEISGSRRFVARAGQFIVSRIDARNGAMGIVPTTLDGAVVTNDFPLLATDKTRLSPVYLGWLCRTSDFVELCLRASEGTTNRVRLKEERFLALEIPLPPLAEQRRIVARIDELAALIYEARDLRQQAAAEAEALVAARLGERFAALAREFPVHTLGELASHILDGPHQTPVYLPKGVAGVPFVTVRNMVSGQLDFTDLNCISEYDHGTFTRRCKPERGDVLYSKDGATRGRPCLVDTDKEFSYFVSVALIKPLRERLDGRYLVGLLNSNWIKDRMANRSRGDMIPHIVLKEIRAFPVPLPDLSAQRKIVAEFSVLQEEVNSLSRCQVETAAELDALLPSILDRVFASAL